LRLLEFGDERVDFGASLDRNGQRIERANVDDELKELLLLAAEQFRSPADFFDRVPAY